ncbi:hypothetical protein KCU68_g131, partial [Aureobasidium melanogenum]
MYCIPVCLELRMFSMIPISQVSLLFFHHHRYCSNILAGRSRCCRKTQCHTKLSGVQGDWIDDAVQSWDKIDPKRRQHKSLWLCPPHRIAAYPVQERIANSAGFRSSRVSPVGNEIQ